MGRRHVIAGTGAIFVVGQCTQRFETGGRPACRRIDGDPITRSHAAAVVPTDRNLHRVRDPSASSATDGCGEPGQQGVSKPRGSRTTPTAPRASTTAQPISYFVLERCTDSRRTALRVTHKVCRDRAPRARYHGRATAFSGAWTPAVPFANTINATKGCISISRASIGTLESILENHARQYPTSEAGPDRPRSNTRLLTGGYAA